MYIAAESIRDARTILQDKEVLGDVTTVVDELADGATLEEAFTGWETEYEVIVGKIVHDWMPTRTASGSNTKPASR